MADYEKLCEELRMIMEYSVSSQGNIVYQIYQIQEPSEKELAAADAIEELQTEVEILREQLETAVKELHGNCSSCIHYTESHNQGKCKSCIHEIFPRENPKEDNWRWEGETNV